MTFCCCKFQLGLSTWILNKAVVKLDAEKCQNMVPFPFNHLGFPSWFLGRYYLRYQSLQPCFALVRIPRPACEGQSQLHDPAQQVVLPKKTSNQIKSNQHKTYLQSRPKGGSRLPGGPGKVCQGPAKIQNILCLWWVWWWGPGHPENISILDSFFSFESVIDLPQNLLTATILNTKDTVKPFCEAGMNSWKEQCIGKRLPQKKSSKIDQITHSLFRT